MRKELVNTYTYFKNDCVGVKARTPAEKEIEYEIGAKDLILNINYADAQGAPKTGKVTLKPVVAEVLRLDKILPNDLHLMYVAALNCYSGLETPELIAKAQTATNNEAVAFLDDNVISTKHWSVLEHRGPSFLVGGVSRAFSHQFVRHRLFTFSQQSQRYLDLASQKRMEKGAVFSFIIPPSIRSEPKLVKEFVSGIKNAVGGYYSLRANGAFPEDARFLFPNAAATRLVVSGNNRVWLELIPKRTCARAQWEIDMVVTEIARQLLEDLTIIFDEVGPECSLGKCNQGKRSCGQPLNKPLREFFGDLKYPHDNLIFGMR